MFVVCIVLYFFFFFLKKIHVCVTHLSNQLREDKAPLPCLAKGRGDGQSRYHSACRFDSQTQVRRQGSPSAL